MTEYFRSSHKFNLLRVGMRPSDAEPTDTETLVRETNRKSGSTFEPICELCVIDLRIHLHCTPLVVVLERKCVVAS